VSLRALPLLLSLAVLPGCVATPPPQPAPAPPAASTLALDQLRSEARKLSAVTTSVLARRFLDATARLPHVSPRTLYTDATRSRYLSARQAAALAPEQRATLTAVPVDEEAYYETNYGTPLSYARPLDVLAAHGVSLAPGARIFDFGYGYVGHLRLLASLGFHATGVDVDPMLRALYSEPGDQGNVQSEVPGDGAAGSIRLLDGHYPADAAVVHDVGSGYDLVVSKNVLKRGYIHPDRPADPKHLIDLRVPDEAVLQAFFAALSPGGAMLIYNVCPALTPPDKPFVPWSDGRSPFSREAWKAAGFEVVAFDQDDTAAMNAVAHLLGWGEDPDDKWDIDHDLSVLYTLVKRPR
jgi:hypothetical protein